jgi:PAS domain S-box-containing protein
VVSLRIFFRDVTEQVSANNRGRLAKSRLESVLALSTAVLYCCPAVASSDASFVSENVELLWGYRPAEFVQRDFWLRQVHPEDRERVLRVVAEAHEKGDVEQEKTYRFRNARGEWRWVHDHWRIGATGLQPQQEIIGVMTDITGQIEADLALRDSQARALRLQGTLLSMRHHNDDLGKFFRRVIKEATAALEVASTGIWFAQPDGALRPFQDLFPVHGGHEGGAQPKLARFPRLFGALEGQACFACDDVQRDPRAAEIPGSDLAGRDVTSFLCAPLSFQDRILGLVVFLHEGPPRGWRDEEVKFAVALAADIVLAVEHTKRVSAEAAAQDLRLHLESLVRERTRDLAESELRFRQLAENITEVFYVVSAADGRFLYVSPAFEKVWGIAANTLREYPGLWLEAVDPGDRERVREVLDRSLTAPVEIEYRIVRADGSIRWINDRSFPVRNTEGKIYRRTGIASDITDRRESDMEAMRRQRIETIGAISSGVAHDLNNALAPITLGIHLLRKKYPGEDRIIFRMQSSALHGANMVRQLLTFAKGVQGQRIAIKPATLFREVAVLIEGSFPKNIIVRSHCPDAVWQILGDPTQLDQVLLNLCVNARDAMPHGGLLELEAANQVVDAAYATGVPDARPGKYVTLRVKDSGMGIPEAIIERIFDPFFTTKGQDKGTGLGLSTVLGIVRSHGGFIRVYSQPGAGASFVVHIPVAELSIPQPPLPVDREEPLRGNGETILVVDDEPAVREITAAALAVLNFRAIVASDGTDALIRAAENRAVLRGVISDLHMAHMDGIKVVQSLRQMLPDVPIVIASGRIDEREARELAALGVVVQLHKPFTEASLILALRKLMHPDRTTLEAPGTAVG